MGTLIIKRTSEYSYKLRDFAIYVDDEKIGQISNSETKEIEINSGKHSLYAKMDLVISSPVASFEISNNETKAFQVGSSKYGTIKHPKWIWLAALISLTILFVVKIKLNLQYSFMLFIFAMFVLLYFLLLGRNSYISLTEISSEVPAVGT